MKMRTISQFGTVLLACFGLLIAAPGFEPQARAQTYYLRSFQQADGSQGPPMPYDPYEGAEPIVTLDAARQIYQVQDNTNAYALITAANELDAMSTMSADSLDPSSGDGTNSSGGDFSSDFQPFVIGSNLAIQVLQIDTTNQLAFLQLTNTVSDEHYQLLSSNLLSTNGQTWTLGQFTSGVEGTNITPLDAFDIGTNSRMFFRAHHANPVLLIQPGLNAIEPNASTGDPGQTGSFTVQSYYALSNDLPVFYTISGIASNGVDYSNLTGVVTIPASDNLASIFVTPIFDSRIDGAESVVLTLKQTNTYLIDPTNMSATINVEDSSTTVDVLNDGDAIEPNGPPGTPGQVGHFLFQRSDERGLFPDLTVYYTIGGTATNGVDYDLITNSIVIPSGQGGVILDITPIQRNIFDGTNTVTVTLIPTNTYLLDNNSNATVNIADSSTTVKILFGQDAVETNATSGVGQPGIFLIVRTDPFGNLLPMTVNYQISGTASNGVDYQTLSGSVALGDGEGSTEILINTIEEDLIEPNETVTLTIIPNGNAYFTDPANSNQTLTIFTTTGFLTVATNLNNPVGIDYYAPSNSLIISDNFGTGLPLNFKRIFTNLTVSGGNTITNVVVTNWSSISGVQDEVYFAIPRVAPTNSAGFTNGDMFFGNDTGVGYLSVGAARTNLNWCTLSNSVVTNIGTLRGGVCMDQTGTFSNDLIAVTSSGGADLSNLKGIWRVDKNGNPTLITNIVTEHLEGVTTITNDVQRWGPWAGKIITGDEDHRDPITFAVDPLIYTISANGAVGTNHTMSMIPGGIFPEDFHIIPTNSALYVTSLGLAAVAELPARYFRNNVGDLLVMDAGENSATGALFIIHWNAQGSNFITTQINLPGDLGRFEHATFAPIEFPKQ